MKAKKASAKDVAVNRLADQLHEELVRDAPKTTSSIHRDLLLDAFAEVNWKELAEDLVGP